jgi:hypothetical protein
MTRFVGLLAAVTVAACSSSTGPQHLNFEGRSTVSQSDPIALSTIVTVTNTGSTTAQIEVSECPLTLEVFTNPERTGTPAWRQPFQICDAMARLRKLGPGDYYDYHLSATVPSSLPIGVYYIAAEMGYGRVPAGQFVKP